MNYLSTRGSARPQTGLDALLQGIAPDGGLFVPESLPEADMVLLSNREHSHFAAVCETLLGTFLPQLSRNGLRELTQTVYGEETFGLEPARVIQLNPYNEREYLLQLDTGPTGSYKDYALQLLPGLLAAAAEMSPQQRQLLLLAVTSGNTGNAALDSMGGADDMALMVFFPHGGLTPLQIAQMVTLSGQNCYVSSSPLTFDELQTELRLCLQDETLRRRLEEHGVQLTTANSLNFGRLIPQIALYFHAYGQLLRADRIMPGEKINFVIPAGNFGNALAAWYAVAMGLPVQRLILASNRNRSLLDFVKKGLIRPSRKVSHTATPAMDVSLPANVERLLYALSDPPTRYAESLAGGRDFSLERREQKRVGEWFAAGSVDDAATLREIRAVYDRTDYLVDPHTAAGFAVYEDYRRATEDETKTVFVTVASPLRYARPVASALFGADVVRESSDQALLERIAREAGLEDDLVKWQSSPPVVVPELVAGGMRQTILEQLGIYQP